MFSFGTMFNCVERGIGQRIVRDLFLKLVIVRQVRRPRGGCVTLVSWISSFIRFLPGSEDRVLVVLEASRANRRERCVSSTGTSP